MLRYILTAMTLCAVAAAQPQELSKVYDAAQLSLERTRPDHSTSHPSLYTDYVGEGRVRVHSAPIKYVDDDGVVRRIDPRFTLEDRGIEQTYRTDHGPLQVEIKSEGEIWLKRGWRDKATGTLHKWRMRVRIRQYAKEDAGGISRDAVNATRPTMARQNDALVTYNNTLGSDLEFRYYQHKGRIKEDIIVANKPDLTNARFWGIVYDFQSQYTDGTTTTNDALVPEIAPDGDLLFRYTFPDETTRTIFAFKAPYTYDANGAELRSRYKLNRAGSLFGVQVHASDLDTAAYPVTIDPTIETDEDEFGDYLTLRDTAYTSHAYVDAFQAFTLPNLPGATITGGTFNIHNNTNISSPTDIDVDIYAAVVASWSTSSSVGDMNTIAGTMGSAILTTQNFSGTNFALNTFDIGSGIVGAYTDGIPDGLLTVRVNTTGVWDHGTPTVNSVYQDQFRCGEVSSSYGYFWGRYTATHYPYLEVTYTAPSLETATASHSITIGEDDYNGGSGNLAGRYAFAQFTLPDMTGNTVLGGRVYMYTEGSGGGTVNWSVYAKDPSTTWDESSSAASMTTVAGQMGTALHTGQIKDETGEWTSWDITGSVAGTNGILYAYDQSDTTITVMFAWTGTYGASAPTTGARNANQILVGDDDDNYREFSDDSDPTNPVYIEVFYESAGGGPVQRYVGPSVGVLSP